MTCQKEISDLIYNELDYMYCDNCRHWAETGDDTPCQDCHRKYNGWSVSRAVSDRIAEKISVLLGKE